MQLSACVSALYNVSVLYMQRSACVSALYNVSVVCMVLYCPAQGQNAIDSIVQPVRASERSGGQLEKEKMYK
jgi:hypothetical protein